MTTVSSSESRNQYTPPAPPPSGERDSGRTSRGSRGSMMVSLDLIEALRHDSAELQREVLLWQRWIRYGAAILATLGIVFLSGNPVPTSPMPVVGAAGVYLLFCAFTGWFLKYGTGRGLPPQLPAVLLLADNLLIGSLVYLSSPPVHYYRMLILGALALNLTVLYFGTWLGLWSAGLTLVAYLTTSFLMDPHVQGWVPVGRVVAFDGLVFAFIAGVQLVTIGNVRQRLRELREFCKRVEMGDLTGPEAVGTESRRPDDLTLLARSFAEMRSRLIELIGSDPLTGCLNRRALEERLSREWRQAKRRNSQLAVLAVDVDKFKQINDSFGHPTGDIVLQEIALIMRSTARETDAVSRIGGDEFVVLLPDTGWQGAMTFAERLRHNVDEHRFGSDPTPEVTISIGVALARGSDDVGVHDLLEEADRSLYKAKQAGRNRISA